MIFRRVPPVLSMLLVAIVLLVFGRTVGSDWVELDDTLNVLENPHFYPVSSESLATFWTEPFGQLYIPVSYMAFGLEAIASRTIAGDRSTDALRPWLFHLASVTLHAVVVLLVFTITQIVVKNRLAAAAGAAVFAVHPLQVESVAWISEQRGLLAAVFSLVAVVVVVSHMTRDADPMIRSPWYAGATGSLGLALLAKPSAVVAPLLATAMIVYRRSCPALIIAKAVVPWMILALGVAIITRMVQLPSIATDTSPLLSRPLIAADSIFFYAAKVIVPTGLCVAYGRTPESVIADPWSPMRAICVALTVGSVLTMPRLASCRLPLVLFVIPLVPVLGLTEFGFQHQSTVADRYAYLAMLGPACGVAMASDRLFGQQWTRRSAEAVVAGWIIVLAALSVRQGDVWRDTGTLAVQACRVSPTLPWAWNLMSGHQLVTGDARGAFESAERALNFGPGNVVAMLNLAEAAGQLKDDATITRAVSSLKSVGPDDSYIADSFYVRGVSHLKAHRDEEAMVAFGIAIGQNPNHVQAATNLGVLLSRRGDFERATDMFRKAVEVDPRQPAAWVGLGNAVLRQDRPGEAIECYDKALAIEPNDRGTLGNRAWARLAAGDAQGAAGDVALLERLGEAPDPDLIDAISRALRQPEVVK